MSNTTWEKLPYLNGDIDELIQDMLVQATEIGKNNNAISWHSQHTGKFMIGLFILIVALVIIIAFIIWYGKRSMNSKVTIKLPNVIA